MTLPRNDTDPNRPRAVVTGPQAALPKREFIALVAMLFALVAFSIDAMLPALPEIAKSISPDAPNNAQLVLTSFVFGMGVGTLFAGPLSDAFGRRPVIFIGVAIYIAGALFAGQAETLEQMVAARILQGLGVAAPRVVTLAIVRDLYTGREMAQIMSYAMMVFTLVPAVAPLIGDYIIALSSWRTIFLVFVIFAIIITGWLAIRQPETLLPDAREPLKTSRLLAAIRECFSERVFVISSLIQALCLGMLFACLSSTQPIFDEVFGRAESFPKWFALIALLGGIASIINARLVVRLGMRRMAFIGFLGQAVLSGTVLAMVVTATVPFWFYILWTTSVFFMAGLVIGNLNALAMEPLGHIAGLSASLIGAIATVLAVGVAIPIGLAFDGTVLPLAAGTFFISTLCALGVRFALGETPENR